MRKSESEFWLNSLKAVQPKPEDFSQKTFHALLWILILSLPLKGTEAALPLVEIYTSRRVIEEDPKCLQTGCKSEEAQLRIARELLNLPGVLGVVATELLTLRDLRPEHPTFPEELVLAKEEIEVIPRIRQLKIPPTEGEFWRHLARPGDFIGKKSDRNPGWHNLIGKEWMRFQAILQRFRPAKTCGQGQVF